MLFGHAVASHQTRRTHTELNTVVKLRNLYYWLLADNFPPGGYLNNAGKDKCFNRQGFSPLPSTVDNKETFHCQ